MKFNNARQCIHDAFCSNLTTPDYKSKGGTKYNANNAIAHQAEAGLIIRAALEQKPHLRAICLFVNAPEGTANQEDFASLKSKLWRDIAKSLAECFTPIEQGRMVAMLDYLIAGYRDRVHNPAGGDLSRSAALAKIVRAQEEDIEPLARTALTILQDYDNQALQPVWHVVNEQREKHDRTYSKTA